MLQDLTFTSEPPLTFSSEDFGKESQDIGPSILILISAMLLLLIIALIFSASRKSKPTNPGRVPGEKETELKIQGSGTSGVKDKTNLTGEVGFDEEVQYA